VTTKSSQSKIPVQIVWQQTQLYLVASFVLFIMPAIFIAGMGHTLLQQLERSRVWMYRFFTPNVHAGSTHAK
jgi:H+/Cl- antiporter ClcA